MRLKPPVIIEQMIIDEDWCDIFLRIKVNVKLVEAITEEDIAAITFIQHYVSRMIIFP